MNSLSPDVKIFIVRCLARFMTIPETIEAVRERFGIDVQGGCVQHYDPAREDHLARKWQKLFDKERERFIHETSALAASHQNFRLRELELLYRQAKEGGNIKLAASLIAQMAREMGGIYTNHHEFSGPAGAPLAIALQPDDSLLDYRRATAPLAPSENSSTD